MAPSLSLEELQKIEGELRVAVSEYRAAMQSIQKEEKTLEEELVQVAEKERIESLKKTLEL